MRASKSAFKPPKFVPFTEESLARIAKRIADEERRERESVSVENAAETVVPAAGSMVAKLFAEKLEEQRQRQTKKRPNPALIAGKPFPDKLGTFPPELYGKPIEDLDEYYNNQFTFMVVAKDGVMYRFSATKSLFILSPINRFRQALVHTCTHPMFTLAVMLVILVNCGFMASNKDIPYVEEVFTAIYTLEGLVKVLARGLILKEFTYLRDAWNWLDFVVVTLAYFTIAFPESNLAALRTFRAFRALKTISVVPGLKLIVGALMEAVRRLQDAIILTIFLLSIFALIGLQLYDGSLLYKCILDPKDVLRHASAAEIKAYKQDRTKWLIESNGEPYLCGNDKIGANTCPEPYICEKVGDNYLLNPNYGFTSFDNFGWSLLCAFRLMTQDYWEGLYQQVLKANGSHHALFFIIVIFLCSFYLVNLILAIVAMSYDDCQKRERAEIEAELAAALEEERQQMEMLELLMRPVSTADLSVSRACSVELPATAAAAAAGGGVFGSSVTPVVTPNSLDNSSDLCTAQTANISRSPKHVARMQASAGASRPGTIYTKRSASAAVNATPTDVGNSTPAGVQDQRTSSAIDQLQLYQALNTRMSPALSRRQQSATNERLQQLKRKYTARQHHIVMKTQSDATPTASSPAAASFSWDSISPPRSATLSGPHIGSCVHRDCFQFLNYNPGVVVVDVDPQMEQASAESLDATHLSQNKAVGDVGGGVSLSVQSSPSRAVRVLKKSPKSHRRQSSVVLFTDTASVKGLGSERASVVAVLVDEDEEMTDTELLVAKLLFGWQCPHPWQVVAQALHVIISDAFFDLTMMLCILGNTVLMALDHADISPSMASALALGNIVFTTIFTVEAAMKLLALGPVNYFRNKWNCFDLVIVTLSLIELGLQGVKGLSILRTFRLLRVFKLAKSWPTLNLLINVIGGTLGALGNLCLVLAIVVFIFAVVGMQLFGENYKAEKFFSGQVPLWNFTDFLHSFMIVFRVLCGEWIQSMWDCMQCSSAYMCIPFFILAMIIGNLVVLNLFLALLLSSFSGTTAAAAAAAPSDDTDDENKLRVAVDRFRRFFIYVSVRVRSCCRRSSTDNTTSRKMTSSTTRPDTAAPATQAGVLPIVPSATEVAVGKSVLPTFAEDEPSLSPTSDDSSGDIMNYYSYTPHSGVTPKMVTVCDAVMANKDYLDSVSDVQIIYVNYPEDCCPTSWRCKYFWWSLFTSTKFGEKWWTARCYANKLVDHKFFEMFIIATIIGSSVTLAVEDKNIHDDDKFVLKIVLACLDKLFNVVFLLELLLKLTAYGFRRYFTDGWCWLDFFIVTISVVSMVAERAGLGNIDAFRALRTLRALRPLRAVSRWEGMKVVVNALIQAIPAIFNVLLVCLVFWLIFSIMGVNLFAGRFGYCVDSSGTLVSSAVIANKSHCIMAEKSGLNYSWVKPDVTFDSVAAAYLALFQVATFKGWIDLMRFATSITEVDQQPELECKPLMYMYFVLFIIFGSFFTLNLFIGVIIDNFNMNQRKAGGTLEMFLTDDQKRYYNAMKKLGSAHPQKPTPKPRVKFQKFFFKLVTNQKFEIAVMFIIGLNMTCMAAEYHGQPQSNTNALEYANQLFVAVYTLECVLKLMALRWHYFKQPWNVFDISVAVVSVVGLAADKLAKDYKLSTPDPTLLRVIRIFRVTRVLRLVKSAKGIRTLLFSLAVSLPALFNIGLLLFLIMFIYAVFGMQFFMNIKHTNGIDDMFNFETFGQSMILLFQVATSAGWDGVLAGLLVTPPKCDPTASPIKPYGDCGQGLMAVGYLVTYLVISFLVIINMYIAVILENFNQATEDVQEGLTQDDVDMYYDIWARFDPKATEYMPLEALSEFVDTLEEPLRIPAPNHLKLIALDIPIFEGDLVNCVDVLDALTKNFLGTSNDAAGQLTDVLTVTGAKRRKPLLGTTRERQRREFCAKLIQMAWRRHVKVKQAERAAAAAAAAAAAEKAEASAAAATPIGVEEEREEEVETGSASDVREGAIEEEADEDAD